ncbi:MAG: hypothetical protein K1Y36_15480 [Blastocatellia bacterium]|nr:hypothetical protein [Blastocatellia bacterium]
MDEALQLAIIDFEAFLSGQKAPALVGHSLMTVMRTDVRTVSHIVLSWAMRQQSNPLPYTVLQARNKVFDIFFYRIVKFDGIYKFFPSFEATLIQFCPPQFQPNVSALFSQNRWEDIRPIGDIKQQPVFALEKRTEAAVTEAAFNEDIYKNVTHNILALENRYTFADEKVGAEMAEHTARVANLFKDFVGFVKDKQSRKEIFVANEADKDAVYENKKRFNIEDYVVQSLDVAVAFFNDDFLLQSVQMIDLIMDLAQQRGFSIEGSQRFQSKYNLFSTRKIEEYTNNRINRSLVGSVLGIFKGWYPLPLLDQLQVEENRRTRRIILNVLECYGSGIHSTLLAELMNCSDQTPWYYIRNLVYLLGKIVVSDPQAKNQVADSVDRHLRPTSMRPLNLQCISTLGFLANEAAQEKLIAKLATFRKFEDAASVEMANKIALTLIGFETEKAIDAALDFALKHWSNEYVERFSQVNLPTRVVSNLANKIRAEIKKMRMTFSLLGNVETAANLLRAIGQSRSEEVRSLCLEIQKTLPATNALHMRAKNLMDQPTVTVPELAPDKLLNRLALAKNVPEMVLYAFEAGMSGKLRVKTIDAVDCSIEFDHGEAQKAGISSHYVDQENAFYWTFLLDPRDINQVTFGVPSTNLNATLSGLQLNVSTHQLIHEALLQKGEVQQIASNSIMPDSRFSQRKVSNYFLQFKGAEDPAKCKIVWDALALGPDINTLQQVTRLSKFDLYKILFYLNKQNLVLIDADKKVSDATQVGDGLNMLELYLQRIAKKPVLFNSYKASAEVCEEIATASTDDVVKFAMGVLHRYYWNAFASRQVFVEANLAVCDQVIELVATYVKAKTPVNKEALLSYINFSFQEQDASLLPPPPPVVETTVLQKLENIQLGNDAFDDDIDKLFDESAVDDMFGALDTAMGQTGSDIPSFGQDSGLTETEEMMLMDLYDNIAVAYVKPLKDFIREIQLNQKIKRKTSLEWIEMVEPSVNLLYGSAEKMGYTRICNFLGQMKEILESQKAVPDQTYLLDPSAVKVLELYEQLALVLPKTFALELSESDLNSKKEVLIVKFILKQLPEINEKMMNRIILAGLSTFDKFMHSSPDEISAVTGLNKKQGEDVFMKFYQYRHIYYRHNDDEYKEKFIEMYEVKLNILTELHQEIESLIAGMKNETDELKAKINGLKMDRQRTLWSIFILLCIKEEYDLIEMVQQSVFDVRLQRLGEYLDRLATV